MSGKCNLMQLGSFRKLLSFVYTSSLIKRFCWMSKDLAIIDLEYVEKPPTFIWYSTIEINFSLHIFDGYMTGIWSTACNCGVSHMVKKVRSKNILEEISLKRKRQEWFSLNLVTNVKAIDRGFLLYPHRRFATHANVTPLTYPSAQHCPNLSTLGKTN